VRFSTFILHLTLIALAAIWVDACSKSPPVVTEADVAKAFAAAFHGADTETVADTALHFEAKRLVPVADGLYALVAEGTAVDPNTACHACLGKLRIVYLGRDGGDFSPVSPQIRTDLDGDGFGAAPEWKVGQDGDDPALIVTTGYTEQGCTETHTATYRLLPAGPIEDKSKAKQDGEC
jgi:hypothetical protein